MLYPVELPPHDRVTKLHAVPGLATQTRDGEVRDCTQKLRRTGGAFESLSRTALKGVRTRLAAGVRTCNRECYSNCAFDSAFYARHKFRFLRSGVL